MRLLYYLLLIMMLAFITLALFVLIGYTGYQIYSTAKNLANQTIHQYNESINVSDYDIMEKTMPFWIILDTAIIIAFIIMIVAVFMHSKKR